MAIYCVLYSFRVLPSSVNPARTCMAGRRSRQSLDGRGGTVRTTSGSSKGPSGEALGLACSLRRGGTYKRAVVIGPNAAPPPDPTMARVLAIDQNLTSPHLPSQARPASTSGLPAVEGLPRASGGLCDTRRCRAIHAKDDDSAIFDIYCRLADTIKILSQPPKAAKQYVTQCGSGFSEISRKNGRHLCRRQIRFRHGPACQCRADKSAWTAALTIWEVRRDTLRIPCPCIWRQGKTKE
jgi:hypothetical protein